MTTTTPRARRMSRSDRAETLLGTAGDILRGGNIAGVTFDAVADAAGVAKTLPYAYFSSRDELLVAIFHRVVGAVDARVANVVAESTSFSDALRGGLNVWFDAVRDDGPRLAALLDGRAIPALAPVIDRRDKASHKLWRDAVGALLDLPNPDAHVLAATINRSATGVVDLWVTRRGRRDELIDAAVTMLVGAGEALRAQ